MPSEEDRAITATGNMHETLAKFGGFQANRQTDRQTNRHKSTHRNTSHPSAGKVIRHATSVLKCIHPIHPANALLLSFCFILHLSFNSIANACCMLFTDATATHRLLLPERELFAFLGPAYQIHKNRQRLFNCSYY